MFRLAGGELWSLAQEFGPKHVFDAGCSLFGYPPTWDIDPYQLTALTGRLRRNDDSKLYDWR